jgi:hypothetical protein
VRRGDNTFKGYELDWFTDAFGQYLGIEPTHPSQPPIGAAAVAPESRHIKSGVTDSRGGDDPREPRGVTGVTARAGERNARTLPAGRPVVGRASSQTRGKSPALESSASLFDLSDLQMALLEKHGWGFAGFEPPEDVGHA